MSVWVLFVLVSLEGDRKAGLANFQQEFKTLEACRLGSSIITNRFQTMQVDVKALCLQVAK